MEDTALGRGLVPLRCGDVKRLLAQMAGESVIARLFRQWRFDSTNGAKPSAAFGVNLFHGISFGVLKPGRVAAFWRLDPPNTPPGVRFSFLT